ncbi:MAG: hypothetical protein QOD07_1411 [Frankiaceae bacterium]|nr:hypothetical protein [Frankiaceae bacterium]
MSPSSAAIRRSLRALTEADYPSTYFDEMADPVGTPDGHGGVFTAVVAVRQLTADGHGQIVAFWHDKQFVGWVPGREVASVGAVTPHGPGAFDVEMALYGPGAAMCCPSGSVHVVFGWNGHAFAATRRIPADVDLGSVVVHRR